jgi:microcystin-dependent protein
MTGLAWWSQTAATNASVDGTINFAEGQSPSTINDSARALMASAAKWRDDIAGAITTGGTATAFTVTSYQNFDSLTRLNGQMIAFTPHTTNTAGSPSVTLSVDGLTAKPIRLAPNVEIPSGTLIQGTPYLANLNNSDGAFYLFGTGNTAYSIPLGSSIEYWLSTAPNSAFAFPYGQAISRTTYATLYSAMGTTYGSGDGSTTFNLPDCRGRLTVGKDDMGGVAANRITSTNSGITGTTLGSAAGAPNVTIAQNQLPNITPTIDASTAVWNTVADTATGVTVSGGATSVVTGLFNGGTTGGGVTNYSSKAGLFGGSITSSSINGGVTQQATIVMPPAIVCNRILRII